MLFPRLAWFSLLWFGFSTALLVCTLVFLQGTIHGQEHLLPEFNHTLFQFVTIGHWVVVGFMAFYLILQVSSWKFLDPKRKVTKNGWKSRLTKLVAVIH